MLVVPSPFWVGLAYCFSNPARAVGRAETALVLMACAPGRWRAH
ncbi:hypothetical protein amb2855 [Paramagnetospirillum magneticum AMB-1]|uniref:Uncharacterized protein n=1 Tax=Paramagnetospirillum magneticum (strain ATCC 700264 / AMB-1) TaxID=342108 RepID=Q2W3B6_PARM1|nr:hypothetical protein amb2855 [Paramagnetospirillum magneticum AMB-1]